MFDKMIGLMFPLRFHHVYQDFLDGKYLTADVSVFPSQPQQVPSDGTMDLIACLERFQGVPWVPRGAFFSSEGQKLWVDGFRGINNALELVQHF